MINTAQEPMATLLGLPSIDVKLGPAKELPVIKTAGLAKTSGQEG